MKSQHPSSPMAELYSEGRKHFIELVPDGGARLDALFHTAPALGELAVGVVYGHLQSRPGLDSRLREAATLAAIVAASTVGPPLSVHFRTGAASGLALGEIVELVVQASAFTGFPRAVSAADQLNRLFEEAGLASPPPPTPREVTLAFCESVRKGHPPIPVSPEIKRLLRQARRFSAQATSARNVIVECFDEQQVFPIALIYFDVEADRVVSIRLYKAQ
ncbi:carboxymuconolactone decarboxylase family protein [Pseudomonas sp. Pdm06]|uniref:carboxymuconolactone decarboxylase family protein n=1 Tax=Pseudomonas sp. Pdm06 TaxID=1790044 RepID=UPI0017867093|nr:carboxymuconolactone decarboxylase family protein [Pseudomonas sp. Pdm06]MBD9463005.1 carboxymuconolactone decarboxylase family protein [Pseudomonas sp. Pdm06]